MKDKDSFAKGYFTGIIVTLLILILVKKCSSQVFVTPSAQVSIYDQSIGAMAGYKLNNWSGAFNYQIGHQYKEQSLFLKWQINESEVFNVGVSGKVGFVNNSLYLFYPGLEIQRGWFQLGVRPINGALLVLEPRIQIKFK